MNFQIKPCKTRAAVSVKPKNKVNLNLNNIKKEFKVSVKTPILLVLDFEGGIIVHKYGEIVFKKLKDEKKVRKIAKRIYCLGKCPPLLGGRPKKEAKKRKGGRNSFE